MPPVVVMTALPSVPVEKVPAPPLLLESTAPPMPGACTPLIELPPMAVTVPPVMVTVPPPPWLLVLLPCPPPMPALAPLAPLPPLPPVAVTVPP